MIRKLLAILVVVVAVLVAGTAYLFTRTPVPGERVEVAIPAGASTSGIAGLLAEQQVIGSELGFRVMARVRGLDGRIQAGDYELRRGMGVRAALDALVTGPIDRSTSVTIPEGYTVKQIVDRVAEKTHISSEDMLDAVGSDIRASIQPDGVDSLEGFLFPDTYRLSERETADQLVRRMVAEFESRAEGLDWSVPEARGLTRYEALILASLVEREAKTDEDRPKVAAVIYNRLRRGMRLQIDITALYDAPRHKIPTRRDLQRESPYNTYLNDGLPPTPIANPGIDSLRAALNPADIPAIYYVVIDRSGKHGFAETEAEFQRLRRQCPPEYCARRSP